jgi:hypothetical protein
MPPTGFEPTIAASKWPYSQTLDCVATGIGMVDAREIKYKMRVLISMSSYLYLLSSVMWFGRYVTMFQINLLPQSSG